MFRPSTLEPITTPRSSHPLLADIESHLTRQQFNYYCGFPDLTTNIHEGTHGLQANIRNQRHARMVDAFYERDARYFGAEARLSLLHREQHQRRPLSQVGRDVWSHQETPEGAAAANGERANAFYVFQNQYAWWPEPSFRKSQVGAFVPKDFQSHHLFRTYVSGATAWDDSPLYLWDEWTAYCNGAEAGESNSEIEFATIFGWFARAVLLACDKHDPESRQLLTPFFEWQVFRLESIVDQHGTDQHRDLFNRMQLETLGR